jgi:site-specific DNA-adenine methylase
MPYANLFGTEAPMNPVLKYRGGKSREISSFLSYIPDDFDRYIEPFLGGGALYFYIEPEKAVLNDVNERLMTFYRQLRNDYPRMRRQLDELQGQYEANRLAYEALKTQSPDERVPNANEDLYYYGNIDAPGGFGKSEHRRLAADFRNLPCRALMIIGKTPLTDELYRDFIVGEYHKNYAVNIKNRFNNDKTHIIACNYPSR